MTDSSQASQATPDPLYDLSQALDLTLSALKDAATSAHVNTEQRAAFRYLHERIMNYYGMMRSRKLTGSIEFLIPYHDGKRGCTTAGWYYAARTGDQSRNWHGPFASYKLAVDARDRDKPKTKIALSYQILDQLAD